MSLIEARIHNARVFAVANVTGAEIAQSELMLTTVCGNCFIRRPRPTLEEALAVGHVLISPTGCVHSQSFDDGSTDTCCGLDATLTDWWWPL